MTTETENKSRKILKISTVITEPLLIEIDGEDYEMRTYQHLSPADEATVQKFIKREEKLQDQISKEDPYNDKKIEELVGKQRRNREMMISTMTEIPERIYTILSMPALGDIFTSIAKKPKELIDAYERTHDEDGEEIDEPEAEDAEADFAVA